MTFLRQSLAVVLCMTALVPVVSAGAASVAPVKACTMGEGAAHGPSLVEACCCLPATEMAAPTTPCGCTYEPIGEGQSQPTALPTNGSSSLLVLAAGASSTSSAPAGTRFAAGHPDGTTHARGLPSPRSLHCVRTL